MIPLAVFGSVVIGLVLLFFVNRKLGTTPYILVVDCDSNEAENKAIELIKKETDRDELKSKSIEANHIEINMEVRLKKNDSSFINNLSKIPGVNSAVLVSYNSEFMR